MSRYKLAVTSLTPFITFCEEKGWVQSSPRSYFEVLRMYHPDFRDPLIVHKRLQSASGGPLVHYTTWGNSDLLMDEYLAQKKEKP